MSKRRPISEFDLINDYFAGMTPKRGDVVLGVGDDAALLRVPQGMDLAVSMDTLVAGVHFFPDTSPVNLGHKTLAVNLSDLAAMGAEPAWATLALTLPEVDEDWLREFCRGFAELAGRYKLQLVGGDTTSGPLSITVQVHGLLPEGTGITRGGARVGDEIYVTGTLGDAAMALSRQHEWAGKQDLQRLGGRLEWPIPRVEAGLALRGLASSAIDILGIFWHRAGSAPGWSWIRSPSRLRWPAFSKQTTGPPFSRVATITSSVSPCRRHIATG
ncbi:MAG: thiamine-phosphate kinase [Candidatus Thiodiazotropha sp.]